VTSKVKHGKLKMEEYIHITYDPMNFNIIFESDKFFFRQDKIKHDEYSLAIGLAYSTQQVEVEIWDKKRFPIKKGVFTKWIPNFMRKKHQQ
jgi:hypothetical protein